MKEGIRILGVDDSAFNLDDEETTLNGVVYRGNEFIEEIVFKKVKVDGDNATEKLIDLFDMCNNHRQLKVIMTDGLSFAGLNPVDIKKVSEKTGKPVIATTKNEPDRQKFRSALEKNGNKTEHLELLDNYSSLELEDGRVFFQFSGINKERAEDFICLSIINGRTPEPIRVADMIGSAMKEL